MARASGGLAAAVPAGYRDPGQAGRGRLSKAGRAEQDTILASPAARAFLSLLFEHTIEGLYRAPEYEGIRGLAGWTDIGYPGDSQPRGYPPDEVSRSDGPDPAPATGVVAETLKFLGTV